MFASKRSIRLRKATARRALGVQRQMVGRDSERLREQTAGRAAKLRSSRTRRFVNRSHNRPDDYHLDEATDAAVNDQLTR